MNWTKDKPSIPGWYWFRYSVDHTPSVVEVTQGECGCFFREHASAVKVGTKAERWAGPIEEPQGEKERT